jgi:predicted DNA-binding transcriptional regulator AlpA
MLSRTHALMSASANAAQKFNQFDVEAERFLSTNEMCRFTGYSRTTLWRRIREGSCVQPVKLSPRRLGFPLSEVRAWQRNLMQARAVAA